MNQKHDVLIIGGGIIGLMCAYYLQKQGKSVLVLEKGKREDACSHANCGLVSPSHAFPLNSPSLMLKAMKWVFQKDSPFYIKPQFDINFLSWMVGFGLNAAPGKVKKSMLGRASLLLESKELYTDFFKEESVKCNWSEEGIMFAFQSEKAFNKYQTKDKQLTELNASLKAIPLVGEQLKIKEPALSDNVYGGWWYKNDASLKPDELITELRKVLIANEVGFAYNTAVEGFNVGNGKVTSIQTSTGNYVADKYVLATGAWSPELVKQLDIKIPIIPGKGYSITMKKPSISPSMPCIMEEKKVVATPWNGTYRLGGTMEFAGYNSDMNPHRFQALRNAASSYMKEPYSDEVIENWFGWRPMTNNGLPIIDFSKHQSNLIMACGHNMLGLSMATSTGKLVSEMLYEKDTHIDPSYYSMRGNLN